MGSKEIRKMLSPKGATILLENNELVYFYKDAYGDEYTGRTLEELKANYKSGTKFPNTMLFNQYTQTIAPQTLPKITSVNEKYARRERYEDNEDGRNLHFLGRSRRRATSHKFGGDAKRLSRRRREEAKALFGNYSEEEKRKSKGKRGNDYAQVFDSDDTEVRFSAKGVSDNKTYQIPVKTKPSGYGDETEAPPVKRAKGKKIKVNPEQDIDTSPEILGIDQATEFMHN
jgi:hypothetical protein